MTMSSTVEWAMAMLLKNPEKMTKARVELEEVLGKAGRIQELDISKFLYLQAIVKETLRLHPSAPFLLPRKAMIDRNMWLHCAQKCTNTNKFVGNGKRLYYMAKLKFIFA